MTRNSFDKRNPPARISLADVERVYNHAKANCCLENFVLVRLFKQLGPRTREVCWMCVEDIDFETCHVRLLDSKKYEFFNLGLDVETVELLKLLVGNRTEGYVFRQMQSWKKTRDGQPLNRVTLWTRIRKIAEDAGVKGFKPRTFRQWFAGYWRFKKRGSMKGLQGVLRHNSEVTTDAYVGKLILEEDVESEYRLLMDPIARALHAENLPEVCRDCQLSAVCKHVDELLPYSEVVTGCRFKKPLDARSNSPQIHRDSAQSLQ